MSINFANATAVPSVYANTDFTSLSWLEHQWVAWYVWIGNPIIATGLMSFLLHEVCRVFVDTQFCFRGLLMNLPLRLSTLVDRFHGLS